MGCKITTIHGCTSTSCCVGEEGLHFLLLLLLQWCRYLTLQLRRLSGVLCIQRLSQLVVQGRRPLLPTGLLVFELR